MNKETINQSATLCVFRADEYGTDKAGFLAARADGADYHIQCDNGDCNYSIMYSVQAAATAVKNCLGGSEIEMGVFSITNGIIEYASMSEIDDIELGNGSYSTIADGFEKAIENRAEAPTSIANACKMLISMNVDFGKRTALDLAKIGRTLAVQQKSSKGLPLMYDDQRTMWVGKPSEPKYYPDPETGLPHKMVAGSNTLNVPS